MFKKTTLILLFIAAGYFAPGIAQDNTSAIGQILDAARSYGDFKQDERRQKRAEERRAHERKEQRKHDYRKPGKHHKEHRHHK